MRYIEVCHCCATQPEELMTSEKSNNITRLAITKASQSIADKLLHKIEMLESEDVALKTNNSKVEITIDQVEVVISNVKVSITG